MTDTFRKEYSQDEHLKNMAYEIKDFAKDMEEHINTILIDSREKSLALTKLEECVMWAVKGVYS